MAENEIRGIINGILLHEGGYVDDPLDKGGPTKFGITQATLSKWRGRPATADDVKCLHERTAREIYTVRYYLDPKIDTLPFDVQSQVTDCAVNHGPRRGVKFAQQVCNLAGFGPIAEDGVIGPTTRRTIAHAYAEMGPLFGNAIADQRLAFYAQIIRHDPSQARFKNGWERRANSFKEEV